MAEEESEQQAEAKPAEQRSLLRYLPLVLLVLLLQAGAMYFLIDYRFSSPEDVIATVEDEAGRSHKVAPEGAEPEASVEIKDIIVNPRGTRARYLLTVDVTLAVWPDDAKAEIEEDRNTDRVRDAVIAALGNATPEVLRTQEGREKVKRDMMERINFYLYEGQVVGVYFGKLIQQATVGYRKE